MGDRGDGQERQVGKQSLIFECHGAGDLLKTCISPEIDHTVLTVSLLRVCSACILGFLLNHARHASRCGSNEPISHIDNHAGIGALVPSQQSMGRRLSGFWR